MSRHRNVKQLIDEDYYDDYDDDEYYDDDGYDDYDTYTGASASVNAANKAASKSSKNTATGTASGPSKKAISPKQQKQKQQPTQAKLKNSPLPLPPPPGFSVASPPRSSSAAGSALLSKSPLSRTTTPPAASTNISSSGLPPLPDILLADTRTTTKKTHLTVVVLGHVDAGKSTVTGHLLYGSSGTSKNGKTSSSNTQQRRNNPQQQSINYAWLLDEDEQERAHGVTMDIATKQLETTNFHIVLQDAPGHSDYVPAMITGTSAADAAMLTVDATDLHTALHSGGGQLREHAFLAKGLGVQQLLVVLNKMDLIGWDNQEQYEALKAEMWRFLTQQVHYAESKIRFVPVSGLTGTNIFAFDELTTDDDDTRTLRSWYKGPTLQEALDAFEPPVQQQSKLLEKPLRMVVAEVLDSGGTGVALRAKVVTGWAKQGESLVVLPVGDETVLAKVSSLHRATNNTTSALSSSSSSSSDERRQYCVAGELIDCTVTGIDAQRISTGSVLARPRFRPPLADRCRAKIFVLDGMNNSTIPLIRGAQAIFHMHHLDIPCNLAILVRTLKPDGTTILKERPRALTRSCTAIVELQLSVPICMEAFSDCRALARFVLRRSGESIAVGRIEEVLIKK